MALPESIPETNRSVSLIHKYVYGEDTPIGNNISLQQLSRDAITSSLHTFINDAQHDLSADPNALSEFEIISQYQLGDAWIKLVETADDDIKKIHNDGELVIKVSDIETLKLETRSKVGGEPFDYVKRFDLKMNGAKYWDLSINHGVLFDQSIFASKDGEGKFNELITYFINTKWYINDVIAFEYSDTINANNYVHGIDVRQDDTGDLEYDLKNSGQMHQTTFPIINYTDKVYVVQTIGIDSSSLTRDNWWYEDSEYLIFDNGSRHYLYSAFASIVNIRTVSYKKNDESEYVSYSPQNGNGFEEDMFTYPYAGRIQARKTPGRYYISNINIEIDSEYWYDQQVVPYNNGIIKSPDESMDNYNSRVFEKMRSYPIPKVIVSDISTNPRSTIIITPTSAIDYETLKVVSLPEYDYVDGEVTKTFMMTLSNVYNGSTYNVDLKSLLYRHWLIYCPESMPIEGGTSYDKRRIGSSQELTVSGNIIMYVNDVEYLSHDFTYNSTDDSFSGEGYTALKSGTFGKRQGFEVFDTEKIFTQIHTFNVNDEVKFVVSASISDTNEFGYDLISQSFFVPGFPSGYRAYRSADFRFNLDPEVSINGYSLNYTDTINTIQNGRAMIVSYRGDGDNKIIDAFDYARDTNLFSMLEQFATSDNCTTIHSI